MDGVGAQFVFFDVRDTLGDVVGKGKLALYLPSTEVLLSTVKNTIKVGIGIITNLPPEVSAADGRRMLDEAGLTPFLDPNGIIINHEAPASKPAPEIYRYAAEKVGVPVHRCLFIGENLLEVIGAEAAGMRTLLKPWPPRREFIFGPLARKKKTDKDSGRYFEKLFESEHAFGERILHATKTLAQRLEGVTGAPGDVPSELVTAMDLVVFVMKAFVDPYHHKKEEQVLFPLAGARGMDRKLLDQCVLEHDAGRAYFSVMEAAMARIRAGDPRGVSDYRAAAAGFVEMYVRHGQWENDVLMPKIGAVLTDLDDAILLELIRQVGPADVTPWREMVGVIEGLLGIPAP